MIHAYVTSQCCVRRDAVNPGEYVGDRRVHTHGDEDKYLSEEGNLINLYLDAGAVL